MAVFFENGPITGSSNHIATLSYSSKGEDGVIEIVMDRVYELKTEYDNAYYYFDFLTKYRIAVSKSNASIANIRSQIL